MVFGDKSPTQQPNDQPKIEKPKCLTLNWEKVKCLNLYPDGKIVLTWEDNTTITYVNIGEPQEAYLALLGSWKAWRAGGLEVLNMAGRNG